MSKPIVSSGIRSLIESDRLLRQKVKSEAMRTLGFKQSVLQVALNSPPIVTTNAPTLALANITQSTGSYVVGDSVLATATTDDSDGKVTTGVDLYDGASLVGHFAAGPVTGQWKLTTVPTAGAHTYKATRIFATGTADSNNSPITVLDVLAPDQVTSATLLFWARTSGGECIQMGSTLEATGTTPPAITVSTTGTLVGRTEGLVISVPTGGARGTAKLNVSLDNGATSILVNVLTAATIAIPGTDLTINCPTGTYSTNNVYRAICSNFCDKVGAFPSSTNNFSNASVGTTRPYIIAAGALGTPCIRFDGVNDILTCTGNLAANAYGGTNNSFYTLSLVNVITFPGAAANLTFWCASNLTNTSTPFTEAVVTQTTGQFWRCQRRDDTGAAAGISSNLVATLGGHLLEYGFDGSLAVFEVNGTDVIGGQSDVGGAQTLAGTITPTQVVLGVRQTQAGIVNPGNFDLYEHVVFDSQPSDVDRIRLRRYFNA